MSPINVPIVSGSPNTATCLVAGAQTYFVVFVTAAVTLHISFGNETPHSETITVVITQDGSGHTVSAGSEFATLGTVTSTASNSTVTRFFYDEYTALWWPLGQSSAAVV